MTLTIELPDNLQAALKLQAQAQGVSEAGYIRFLLERTLTPSPHEPALSTSAAEKARAFERWARSHPYTPPLSDEAIARENLIRDSK